MDYKFKVEFLEPVLEFLENLDPKNKEKILYNIWKSRSVNDNELFKKLDGEIWEFRTLYNKQYLRLFAFWDQTEEQETLVIATHGILKKTQKTPLREIKKAEEIRKGYLDNK